MQGSKENSKSFRERETDSYKRKINIRFLIRNNVYILFKYSLKNLPMDHKASFNKVQKTKNLWGIFSDHNRIKLEINVKEVTRKYHMENDKIYIQVTLNQRKKAQWILENILSWAIMISQLTNICGGQLKPCLNVNL